MNHKTFAAAVVLLFLSLPAFPKGRVELVVIKGPYLDKPIEITDPATLQKLNPWFGKFVSDKGLAPAPNTDSGSYELLFYMHWPQRHSQLDRGDLKLVYNVNYFPGVDDGTGRIYFPGKGDKYYVNAGTILREGIDGTWQWASTDWEQTMRQLNITGKPGATSTRTIINNLTKHVIVYATLIFAIIVFPIALSWSGLVRRRQAT
ncbi:MAG: hypothetical protein ABR555_00385 [Pyrinomonadaceae bacterium]